MAVNTINPLTATFAGLVDQFNQNALGTPVAGTTQPGALLEFTGPDASVVFSVQCPYWPAFVVSGLVVSVAGAGPYTADYTAGSYQYDQQLWNVLAGAQPIGAAHPTLNRIDTLVGDNTGTVTLVPGTAAANPVRPPLANVLILGDVYVPSAASGLPPVLAQPAFINTPANDGDAIVYNAAAQTYLPTSSINAGTNTLIDSTTGNTTVRSQTGNVTVQALANSRELLLKTLGTSGHITVEAATSGNITVNARNGSIFMEANGAGERIVMDADQYVELITSLFLNAVNVILDTVTGTQIGTGPTQKLGFFGATPKVRGAALTPAVNTLTQAGFTVEDTAISALTTGGGTYGFAKKNEGETVIRALINTMARVAELEARLNSTTGNGLIA